MKGVLKVSKEQVIETERYCDEHGETDTCLAGRFHSVSFPVAVCHAFIFEYVKEYGYSYEHSSVDACSGIHCIQMGSRSDVGVSVEVFSTFLPT